MNVSFDRLDIERLLLDVGARLGELGQQCTISIVGGSALVIAAIVDRSTKDIDAVSDNEDVLARVVETIAEESKLPIDWLNTRASPWVPPNAMDYPVSNGLSSGGLVVRVAPDHVLLAMKLAAFRPQDREDLRHLYRLLGISSPGQAVDLVYEVYGEYASEAGGYGADRAEYLLRATAIHRMLVGTDADSN